MKLKRSRWIIAQIAVLCTAVIAAVVSTTLALYVKDAASKGSYGQIALRSYFHSGDGETEETAYTITRPQHMYNLSRLQSLGVFNEKTYFKLGTKELDPDPSHETDESKVPYCYDKNGLLVPFLDMSDSNFNMLPIIAIGSESEPFFGEFDGQNLEIKNLKVYADPEDAGLFGYTAHGSVVKNLFLDNVTINSLGYTADYADLYGDESLDEDGIADGVKLSYRYEASSSSIITEDFKVYPEKTSVKRTAAFDADEYFSNPSTPVPTNAPTVTASWPNTTEYDYKLLVSGDFLTLKNKTQVEVNLDKVYDFFAKKSGHKPLSEGEALAQNYPLVASSAVSVIVSRVDRDGLVHSKVIEMLQFTFTLSSSISRSIALDVRLGPDHGNNIGLVIGHCDGSVRNCYVHNGLLNMNNGGGPGDETVPGSYEALSHGSSGLIGLVGSTVHDFVSESSAAGSQTGTDVGVLDFTTIYDDIVDPTTTFPSPKQEITGGGIKYYPKAGTQYGEWLRYDNKANNYRVTKDEGYISFLGQRVVWTPDLGIFTIATHQSIPGVEGSVTDGFGDENPVSTLHKESNPVTYLYYATGEYSKGSGVPFDKYRDAMDQDTPTQFLLGQHLPKAGEVSVESFKEREMHQNYFFRFQLEKNYRENVNDNLYFADVDETTPGGSFISKYFNYKLVDEDANPIAADSPRCGVAIRDVNGDEIDSLSVSYNTKDFSNSKLYILNDEEAGYPAANSVNFEIKTEMANVTVVAAPNEVGKSAALGVYSTDVDGDYGTELGTKYIKTAFDDPDYAFFMPSDKHFAYFDYCVDKDNNVGQIGTYSSSVTFKEATYLTDATVPSSHLPSGGGEPKRISDQPRLFVHTFKLPAGHYCLGAATGATSTRTIPKIYYICAQGQENGQWRFNDNEFASSDAVEDVDFIKVARYTHDPSTHITTTNITFGPNSAYSPSSTLLQHLRCYVDLAKDEAERSRFAADASDVSFTYKDGKLMVASSDKNKILRLALSTYATEENKDGLSGLTNTIINLLGESDYNSNPIVYTKS